MMIIEQKQILQAASACIFFLLLLKVASGDLKERKIPDRVQACLMAAGIFSHMAGAGPVGGEPAGLLLGERLAGFLCVSFPMLILIFVYPGAFGGGDVKLAAAGGFLLGWRAMLVSGAMAVLTGGAVCLCALAWGKRTRKDEIPFGPFLCAGMAGGYFWGERIAAWYVGV